MTTPPHEPDPDTRPYRVSVVIPTYNRVEPLRVLLESLAAQGLAHGRREVVIADDGSGPEVEALARSFEPRFDRVAFVTGPNGGPGIARNRGVEIARGNVIAFIDSDCLAEPGWLEKIVSAVEAGAGLAHGPVISSVPAFEPFVHSFQVHDDPICGANFALLRTRFHELGGFDESTSRIGEDQEFFERVRRSDIGVVFVADACVAHPPRPKRIAAPWADRDNTRKVYESLRAFYDRCPEWRPERARLNRRLLRNGVLKFGIAMAPTVLLPFFPPAWGLGYGTLVSMSLVKRRRINRVLEAANAPFRVSLRDGVVYGLLEPVNDLATLALARRHGIGWLSADPR